MNSEFPQRLRKLRESRGKTQQVVGDFCGVSKSMISVYESGEVEPTASVLKKMATYFGVSSDYMLGLTEKENF